MLYILPRDANATWAHLLAYLDGKRSIWNSLDWRQHIKHVEINGEHLNNSRGNARMEKPAKTNLPFLESLMICNIYFFANTSSFKVFFVAVSVALTLQHRVEATAVWCGWQVCLYLEAICVKNLFFRTGMQHLQPVTIQKTHLSRSGAERCKKARWESDLKCSFLSAAPEAREAQGRHHCIDWGAFFFYTFKLMANDSITAQWPHQPSNNCAPNEPCVVITRRMKQWKQQPDHGCRMTGRQITQVPITSVVMHIHKAVDIFSARVSSKTVGICLIFKIPHSNEMHFSSWQLFTLVMSANIQAKKYRSNMRNLDLITMLTDLFQRLKTA